MEGVEQPTFPFWSPDGKYIGFFSAAKLKKVALAGGPVQVLCDAPEGRGASWSPRGVIIFTPNIFEPLYKVPEGGGTPEKITEAKPGWTNRNPYFLPDGDHFLFIARDTRGTASRRCAYTAPRSRGRNHAKYWSARRTCSIPRDTCCTCAKRCWWRSASIRNRSSSAATLSLWPKSSTIGTRATSRPSPPRMARSSSVMDHCRRLSPCGWTARGKELGRFGEPGLYSVTGAFLRRLSGRAGADRS